MLGYLISILLLIATGVEGYVIVRGARRMLQMDDAIQEIWSVLEEYRDELRGIMGGGLLADSPEVLAFHRLNVEVMEVIEAILAGITRPPPPPVENLPRPEAE